MKAWYVFTGLVVLLSFVVLGVVAYYYLSRMNTDGFSSGFGNLTDLIGRGRNTKARPGEIEQSVKTFNSTVRRTFTL